MQHYSDELKAKMLTEFKQKQSVTTLLKQYIISRTTIDENINPKKNCVTLFTNISNSTIQSDLIQAITIKRPHQKKANIYQNRFVSNQEFKCDCFFLLYLAFHLFPKYVSHFASFKKQLKTITKHNKYTEKQDKIKKSPIVVTNKMFRLQ